MGVVLPSANSQQSKLTSGSPRLRGRPRKYGARSRTEKLELLALLEERNRREQRAGPNPFENEWDFLSRACFTRDEATRRILRFPSGERWEYLRELTAIANEHKILVVDKSRRMLITWWGMARWLYYTLTDANSANWVASDKLEKSAYLLGSERMWFIYEHIPPVSEQVARRLESQGYDPGPFREQIWPNKPELLPRGLEAQGRGWRTLICPSLGSSCTAVARGETQMQQYTATRIFCDEFSRWERASEAWSSLVPTVQGSDGGIQGHIEVVGTPELGAYMFDLMEGGRQA